MLFRWTYKDKIFAPAHKVRLPTRGIIYIGSRTIAQRAFAHLPSLSMCCYDLEKIEFSLRFPADKYITAPADKFELIHEGATNPSTFCDGDFDELLNRQRIHSHFRTSDYKGGVARPAHVFYSKIIEDTKSPCGTADIGDFMKYMTSSNAIVSTGINNDGSIDHLQEQGLTYHRLNSP